MSSDSEYSYYDSEEEVPVEKDGNVGTAINAGAESKHKSGKGQALVASAAKMSPIDVPASPVRDDEASKDMQPPSQSADVKDELASKRMSTGSALAESSALVTQSERVAVLDKITKLCSLFVDGPTKESP